MSDSTKQQGGEDESSIDYQIINAAQSDLNTEHLTFDAAIIQKNKQKERN